MPVVGETTRENFVVCVGAWTARPLGGPSLHLRRGTSVPFPEELCRSTPDHEIWWPSPCVCGGGHPPASGDFSSLCFSGLAPSGAPFCALLLPFRRVAVRRARAGRRLRGRCGARTVPLRLAGATLGVISSGELPRFEFRCQYALECPCIRSDVSDLRLASQKVTTGLS